MSHQPFENWLFADEALDENQQQALQAHFTECEQCRNLETAWGHVHDSLTTSAMPEPAPGFTQRWQTKLDIQRQQRQQRTLWIVTLSLFAAAFVILSGLALLDIFSTSWSYVISQFIANFSLLASRINRCYSFVGSLADTFPILIPLMITLGIGLAASISVLIITWFSSLIRLYKPEKEGAVAR